MSKKQALCIGINYLNTKYALAGCINDAYNFEEKLLASGFESVQVLTDNTQILPTRENILRAVTDLILSSVPNLVFTYSGHGTRAVDRNNDEDDGWDECLVPIDHNIILDDELRGLLQLLRPHQKLIVILDCCHSGTGLDLPYNLWTHPSGKIKLIHNRKLALTPGQVIMLSGCLDAQYSADTVIDNKYQGALSGILHQIYRPDLTYTELIQQLRQKLAQGGYTQIPMLSTGQLLSLDDTLNWWDL